MNNTGIALKKFYKVPHGQELPFAGRYLKAVGHNVGAIHFRNAAGNFVTLGNAAAERLAKNALKVTELTPKGFL